MCKGLKNKNYVNLTLRSNGTLNYIDYPFLHTLRSYGTIENLQNLQNLRDFFENFIQSVFIFRLQTIFTSRSNSIPYLSFTASIIIVEKS